LRAKFFLAEVNRRSSPTPHEAYRKAVDRFGIMAQTPQELKLPVAHMRRYVHTPLSNKYTFAVLRDKRAEIAGKVAALHKEIGRQQCDLAKLDGVIRLFDPDYRVGSIPAKGARQRSNLFTHGELSRLTMDALRKAGEPLPTAAIVAMLLRPLDS
jgi:hypothetical protein